LNKEGYNEYHNIGSVRDYFIKNSMGKFRPIFDVYGPVTLPRTQSYYATEPRGDELALTQVLDSLFETGKIDFSQYDNDGDDIVEYTFMLYAGTAISMSDTTIWPHANTLGELGVFLSGKKMGEGPYVKRFACSNEISYSAYEKDESTSILNGIATFIHEFSHLLGIPDFYAHHAIKTLGSWSVMDGGSHNCPSNVDYVDNCAPPFYSAFERMLLGWLTPTEVDANGKIQLNKIDDNVAYSITNPENPDELYLLEYRTNKSWDIGQDNSGMLIWHVDDVDSIWYGSVNRNRYHMHVDIIEARESHLGDVYGSSAYDVFPGKGNVTEFEDFVFWNGLDMNITLSDITESPDKEYVTFNVTMGEPFMRELSSSSSSSSFDVFPVLSSGVWIPYSSPFSVVREDSIISIASPKTSTLQVSVISQNGTVHVTTPLQGLKKVRMFSPNGQLLFETSMEGTDLQFPWPRHLGAQNVILAVSQGKTNLYMGIVNGH
jgi:M6 family metalloprotease-like protein